jgi:hypothetical protein
LEALSRKIEQLDSRLAGAADIGRAVKGVRERNQSLVESI